MVSSPLSLYNICINIVAEECVSGFKISTKELKFLPNNTLFDFYYKLYEERHVCLLCIEQGDLQTFTRLLTVRAQRTKLLKCFQSLLDHGSKQNNVAEVLIGNYSKHLGKKTLTDKDIDIGLKLGGFFNDGGWFSYGMKVLKITQDCCQSFIDKEFDSCLNEENVLLKLLSCCHKKLIAEVSYHDFKAAEKTFSLSQKVIEDLKSKTGRAPNLAAMYTSYSTLFFLKGEYDEALEWSKKSVVLLNRELPARVVIDVLRQASKACVIKRKFQMAGFLIRQAVSLSYSLFVVNNHPQYADTLSDYGFYLLNYDLIEESVRVYEKCLEIRKEIFNKFNLLVASAHEDLAYASYVHEYSSGGFFTASHNAEQALKILKKILPPGHLLIASANRVKALIIEEIALDLREPHNALLQAKYLAQSEDLHKEALALSLKAFGEKNVQTAKHYGNLGRLYQTMKKYKEAEQMHLRAIAIKEELLGENDYEIALSVGHLAALYNYHMSKYHEAEKLYKRSLEINLNLFGPAYSGLEYDYRGITQVYIKLLDTSKHFYYMEKMREWKKLREQLKTEEPGEEILPLDLIVDQFVKSMFE